MTDFILLLIVGACWTWGLRTPFQEGYFLESAGNYIRNVFPKWVTKPLFDCPPCMASFHGAMLGLFWGHYDIALLCVYIICLCGLNFILKSILFPEYE